MRLNSIALLVVALLLVVGSVAARAAAGAGDRSSDEGWRMDAWSVLVGGGESAPLTPYQTPYQREQICVPPEVWENQAKLFEALEALGELYRPGTPLAGIKHVYGGLYIDPWTATIHIGLTRIAEEYTAPIEAIVKQFEGVKVEFFEAQFIYSELRRLQALISAWHRDVGPVVPLTLIGVDVWNNSLVVGLREIRPEYVAAIREIVGDEVPILFEEGELVLDRLGS